MAQIDSPMARRQAFFRPVYQGLIFFVFAGAITLAALAFYSTRWIILTLLFGLGFGVLLEPVIEFLRRRLHFPKALAVLTILLGLLSSMGAACYYSFRLMASQIAMINQELPIFLQRFRQLMDQFGERYPWMHLSSRNFQLTNQLDGLSQRAFGALQGGVTLVGGLFFVLAVGFYLSVSPRSYEDGFLSAFPAHMRPKTRMVLRRCSAVLRAWFISQVIAMLILGIVVGAAMKLIGINYWFVLGLLTAILELVSFVGPLLAFSIGSLITLASQPDKILPVIIIYLIALRLEGDVVIPLVMKGRIELPPIHLLTMLLLLGEWFGVMGLFAAAPFLAVLRTIYLETYVPKLDEQHQPVAEETRAPDSKPSQVA